MSIYCGRFFNCSKIYPISAAFLQILAILYMGKGLKSPVLRQNKSFFCRPAESSSSVSESYSSGKPKSYIINNYIFHDY